MRPRRRPGPYFLASSSRDLSKHRRSSVGWGCFLEVEVDPGLAVGADGIAVVLFADVLRDAPVRMAVVAGRELPGLGQDGGIIDPGLHLEDIRIGQAEAH